MKSLSSLGVTVAILAAAAVGVVTTWLLMRQPQQVVVVLEESPQPSTRASSFPKRPADFVPNANPPPQIIRTASSTTPPVATTSPLRKTGQLPEPVKLEGASPQPVVYQTVNVPVARQANLFAFNPGGAAGNPPEVTITSRELDDALSYALEAGDPYVKEGFTVREDYWGGTLAVKSAKAIVHQLFKGNEYWFWLGTGAPNATISVHIYDSNGNLADAEAWARPHMAAARVVPQKTGSYYLIVGVEKSDRDRTPWSLAYGFR